MRALGSRAVVVLALVMGCSPANQNDAEYWTPSVGPASTPSGDDAGTDGATPPPPSRDCLRVEFTTISYGGRYGPRNVGAVWVTNEAGTFIKTLEEWGTRRYSNLVAWRKSSGGNTVDAVTGATRSSASAHSSTWNCSNVDEAAVPAGNYFVNVEFVENNVSASGVGAGPLWKEAFAVGTAPATLTPAADKSYTNKKIVFTP